MPSDKPFSWEKLIGSIDDATCDSVLAQLAPADSTALPDARSVYRRDGLTIVTGAGVSRSAGIPSWPELIGKLRVETLTSKLGKDGAAELGALIGEASYADSPIVAARSITVDLAEDALRELVRTIFYAKLEDSKTLEEIARLCNKNDHARGAVGVLTYNFDTLLEDRLEKFGHYPRTIYNEVTVGNGAFPVRHVHGFLAQKPTAGERIILTEGAYHEEYARPYSWSNVVQVNAFRETSCLFVGSSMTDPNQRRLLETAQKEHRRAHFAIMSRVRPQALLEAVSVEWTARGQGAGRPKNSEKDAASKRLLLAARLIDHSREAGLRDLGVRVIWVDRYDEIATKLNAIGQPGD